MKAPKIKKILVFRMSSLGDVILSTAFLENLDQATEVDWVIASDFAFLLKGHPRIRNLIVFDKKTGLRGWIKLLKNLCSKDYDACVDLHVTIRTKIARLIFLFLQRSSHHHWYAISKERFRFLFYVTFKNMCPEKFRPSPFWERFARLAFVIRGVTPRQGELTPPSYLSLTRTDVSEILAKYGLISKKYYAFMPASRWSSKEWSARKYIELACTLNSISQATILLVGRENDSACQVVRKGLGDRNIPLVTALTESDFSTTAVLIQQAVAYIGGDTGLAHLSEAVGTPSVVIFGPTRPDLGFGPWSRQSVSVHSNVWCSPCSKDGKICYRFTDRYACLKKIEVDKVRKAVPL